MPASVIDRMPANRRNELLEKISKNSRALRGSMNDGTGNPVLGRIGRNCSQEALLTRMGIIPVVTAVSTASLTAYMQAAPGRRPASAEQVSVAGGTAAQAFAVGDPMKSVAFTAAGAGQAVTATDTVDAAAKGRATVNVPA